MKIKRPSVKKGAAFTISKYKNQNGRCYYCKNKFGEGNKLPTFDHLVPHCEGGQISYDNLVLCCLKCNRDKGCISAELFQDGYVQVNIGARAQGLPDDAPSINVSRKIRNKWRWFNYFINW